MASIEFPISSIALNLSMKPRRWTCHGPWCSTCVPYRCASISNCIVAYFIGQWDSNQLTARLGTRIHPNRVEQLFSLSTVSDVTHVTRIIFHRLVDKKNQISTNYKHWTARVVNTGFDMNLSIDPTAATTNQTLQIYLIARIDYCKM